MSGGGVPGEHGPAGRVQVLLVDDDPTFQALGGGALGRHGDLSVTVASTVADALCTLRRGGVDAVVSDVDLPGTSDDDDGIDLYRAVRERWPTRPFLFFTGRPPRWLSERVDLRADPVVGYVRKGCLPERYDALARRVRRGVERERIPDVGMASTARAIEWFCR